MYLVLITRYHSLCHLLERKKIPKFFLCKMHLVLITPITPYRIIQREKHFQYLFIYIFKNVTRDRKTIGVYSGT